MRPTFPNLPSPQSPFQIPPAINSYPRKIQIDEVLIDLALKSDDIQPLLQKELLALWNGSPNRLPYGVFPSVRRSFAWMRLNPIEWKDLVPRLRTGDCSVIHLPH